MRNLLLLVVALLTLSSCNKKDDLIENQKEQIERLANQVQFLAKTVLKLNQQLDASQSIIESKTLEIAELTEIISTLTSDNSAL
jgi:peptidoglycan hydrolase CwlO-like protein